MSPSKPFVIAEFASCHGGSLDTMLRGIEVARRAGANAFKTWWTSSAERVCARMSAPENLAIYRLGQWPRESLPVIADAVHAAGMEFLVTVDLPEDIPVIAPHVDRFKIASWGATDIAFIEAHTRFGKPLIVSTGLCSEKDITALISEFEALGGDLTCAGGDYWLLHCVSGYPAPTEETNLGIFRKRVNGIQTFDGFSDHTRNVSTGALAVAAGARVLEVHFCLYDTPRDNPDYAVSLTPWQLIEYISFARRAASAMGDGIKRVMPSEEKNVRFRYADR